MSKNNKHTKLPSGWEELQISEIFDFVNTVSFSRENLSKDKTEKEVLYIHYGDIHATYKTELLDFKNESKIPYLKDEFLNTNLNYLQEGDLIIADASEDLVGIGESIEIKNIENKKAIAGLHTFLLRDKNQNTVNGFRTYLLRNAKVHNSIKKIATGTSVYGISKGNLSKLKIPLPPLPEQRAIAAILSTWDTAIQSTQALIAQKEQEKKWLMQNLLTGKKRLKGFENTKWKTQPLENFIKLIVREVPKPAIPYLGIGLRSHGKGTFLKHDEQPEKNSMDKFYVVRPNDLMVNITFAWEQAIAIVRPEDNGALASHRFPTYTFIEEKGHVDFFRFYIILPRMKFMLEMISPGGAGRNRVMSKSDFLKLEFLFPEYEEQTAIAQVLQTADKEINLLKTKLEQQKLQKKGLMQVLLTGKVRVKN